MSLELELVHAFLEPRLKVVGALPCLARIEARIDLACLFLELELLGPVVPVGNFLGEAFFYRGFGLVDELEPWGPHLF